MEMKHTIKNPLKLTWNGSQYKVNKPEQETQELVSKEVAGTLLEALKSLYDSINPRSFGEPLLNTDLSKVGKGTYDILQCKNFGIKGKTTSLSTISVKGSYSLEKVNNCILKEDELRKQDIGKKIKIIKCTAFGEEFSNLTPNSEHLIIEAPKDVKADDRGVWVMGTECPVKVLNNEFIQE